MLIKNGFLFAGLTAVEFVDALPVIFMKPFSGSGARGLMIEIYQNPAFGPDSFVGKLASTFQGSTETTFYVLAVYFGSVKVTDTRYAALAGIICDIIGGTKNENMPANEYIENTDHYILNIIIAAIIVLIIQNLYSNDNYKEIMHSIANYSLSTAAVLILIITTYIYVQDTGKNAEQQLI